MDGSDLASTARAAREAGRETSAFWKWVQKAILVIFCLGYLFSFLKLAQGWREVLLSVVVSGGFLFLLVLFVLSEWRRARKEKYANIMCDLHEICHSIRDVHSILNLFEKDATSPEAVSRQANVKIKDCLTSFASAFSILTGTKCRASIKFIDKSKGSDKFIVYTYMRDQDAERTCREEDERRRAAELDSLEGNTDFSDVFHAGSERWFFSNDLTSRSNYKNSRDPSLATDERTLLKRLFDSISQHSWRLPYKSGIVWPIRQKALDGYSGIENSFYGFLTIDGQHRGIFDSRFDPYLGASVADSLYHVLSRINKASQEWSNSGGQ